MSESTPPRVARPVRRPRHDSPAEAAAPGTRGSTQEPTAAMSASAAAAPATASEAAEIAPARERFAHRPAPVPTLGEKLHRTWAKHPLVALLQHRKRVAFYRQFLSLVRSGAGMPVALAQLARWAPSAGFKRAIEDVARDVARGGNLGEALRRNAATFDDTNVELLVFAEQSGSLDKVLAQIIDYMERMQKLRWSVVMSLIYPAYLVLAFTFVGPLLGLSVGIQEGAALHQLPRLYVSGLVSNLLVLALGFGVFLGTPLFLVALGLDRSWDRVKLRLPLFGPAFRAIHGARFFTSLALGLGAGVEIARTLTLSLRATGSNELAGAAPALLARIRRGSGLAEALEPIAVLDPIALGAIAIAEKTGTLEETLIQLADEASETAVRRCRALALAGVVLLTVAAFGVIIRGLLSVLFGPIWNYYKQLGDI